MSVESQEMLRVIAIIAAQIEFVYVGVMGFDIGPPITASLPAPGEPGPSVGDYRRPLERKTVEGEAEKREERALLHGVREDLRLSNPDRSFLEISDEARDTIASLDSGGKISPRAEDLRVEFLGHQEARSDAAYEAGRPFVAEAEGIPPGEVTEQQVYDFRYETALEHQQVFDAALAQMDENNVLDTFDGHYPELARPNVRAADVFADAEVPEHYAYLQAYRDRLGPGNMPGSLIGRLVGTASNNGPQPDFPV